MKIGVFDSGIGGLSVVRAIQRELPKAEIIFLTDEKHFPYATKSPSVIWRGIVPIFQEFVDLQVDVVVVACNTVSTTLSDKLRAQFPSTTFVMMDPMMKPAAGLTKSGIIAVCATPTTLRSKRYASLKQEYTSGVQVLEPDCSDWSYLIENKQMYEIRIRHEIEPLLKAGTDVIVLACTHYHWIEKEIQRLARGRALVLQPEQAIIQQLKRVLGLSS
jgi:glutamate racemase